MKYNHNRPYSDFQEEITKIKAGGFNPIGVTQMYMEDSFVFETKEEAINAYRLFEKDINEKNIGEITGWWYGKEDFLKEVEDYESHDKKFKVLVYWL